MRNQLKTYKLTPESIIGNKYDILWKFKIPIYQRLYAWGEEQIVQLLDDLYLSFSESNTDENKSRDNEYYVGNLVLAERIEKGG